MIKTKPINNRDINRLGEAAILKRLSFGDARKKSAKPTVKIPIKKARDIPKAGKKREGRG